MKFPGSVLVSLFLFVAETALALYLSSTYRSAGDRIWQSLTLLFALLPCVLVQFSLVFIHRDLSKDRPLVLLLHILQLGPLVRWVGGVGPDPRRCSCRRRTWPGRKGGQGRGSPPQLRWKISTFWVE
uniref:XK-related protein n=1 Tax=Podarcis muralis TaxID=64176 RepID=A0A670KBI5_PODMU